MPSNSTAMGDEQHQKQKEHQQHPRLEQLFRRCDANGTGYIERGDFRSLCQSFGIGAEDSDAIFDDLDHDGDARISFEDFSFGFKDFLTPGARRGSIQVIGKEQNKFIMLCIGQMCTICSLRNFS